MNSMNTTPTTTPDAPSAGAVRAAKELCSFLALSESIAPVFAAIIDRETRVKENEADSKRLAFLAQNADDYMLYSLPEDIGLARQYIDELIAIEEGRA